MRSGKILNKKFFQFLLPTVLSTVAISLNEFVDCIMVSNLLGQHAMALVNMGTPVMLVFAVIYSMFGTGGAAVFASLSVLRSAASSMTYDYVLGMNQTRLIVKRDT